MREATGVTEGTSRSAQDRHAHLLGGVFPSVARPFLVLSPFSVAFFLFATTAIVAVVSAISIVSDTGFFGYDLDGPEALSSSLEYEFGFDWEII
jgi:hypothetical protein